MCRNIGNACGVRNKTKQDTRKTDQWSYLLEGTGATGQLMWEEEGACVYRLRCTYTHAETGWIKGGRKGYFWHILLRKC